MLPNQLITTILIDVTQLQSLQPTLLSKNTKNVYNFMIMTNSKSGLVQKVARIRSAVAPFEQTTHKL